MGEIIYSNKNHNIYTTTNYNVVVLQFVFLERGLCVTQHLWGGRIIFDPKLGDGGYMSCGTTIERMFVIYDTTLEGVAQDVKVFLQMLVLVQAMH